MPRRTEIPDDICFGWITLSGLGLTLLGSLACWSFWFRKAKKRRRPEIATDGLGAATA